jgi:hypothetical protein
MSEYSTSIHALTQVLPINSNDFQLNDKEIISLKYTDCIMILFHTDNIESQDLFKIWNDCASKGSGAKFGECNVVINKDIGEAFIKVKQDCNHPFNWVSVNQYPFILTYRGGWPQAFYNGNRTTNDILNYSLQLACKSCYTEKEQKFKGIEVDVNKEITLPNPKTPVLTTSTEFTNNNYRGYDPTKGVKDFGYKIPSSSGIAIPIVKK